MFPNAGRVWEKSAAGNKINFRARIQMYGMCNGSAPVCTLNASLSERERERQRGCVGVCVSTCYITESGGRECCLACHTTVALRGEREKDGMPELCSTTRNTLVYNAQNPPHRHLYRRACDGAEGHVE